MCEAPGAEKGLSRAAGLPTAPPRARPRSSVRPRGGAAPRRSGNDRQRTAGCAWEPRRRKGDGRRAASQVGGPAARSRRGGGCPWAGPGVRARREPVSRGAAVRDEGAAAKGARLRALGRGCGLRWRGAGAGQARRGGANGEPAGTADVRAAARGRLGLTPGTGERAGGRVRGRRAREARPPGGLRGRWTREEAAGWVRRGGGGEESRGGHTPGRPPRPEAGCAARPSPPHSGSSAQPGPKPPTPAALGLSFPVSEMGVARRPRWVLGKKGKSLDPEKRVLSLKLGGIEERVSESHRRACGVSQGLWVCPSRSDGGQGPETPGPLLSVLRWASWRGEARARSCPCPMLGVRRQVGW